MAGAGQWGSSSSSSPRYGVAAAASPGSRRLQPAGGNSWQREAPRDSLGESEGQAPHSTSDAYIVIPPNPIRRERLQKVASKELEDLAKWKEQHRPGPIISTPQKLGKRKLKVSVESDAGTKRKGGRASESEVRQKQQLEYIHSRSKQKLKKEEYDRLKREAEEADLLKKKAIQREKADRLEEKRRQQEQQRKQMLKEDHYLKTTEFLNRLDLGPSKRTAYETEHYSPESTAMVRSQAHRQIQRQEKDRKVQKEEEQRRKAELLALKQRQEARTRVEAHQDAQWRVNNAFLDRLQNNSQPGGIYQSGCLGNRHFSADSWLSWIKSTSSDKE